MRLTWIVLLPLLGLSGLNAQNAAPTATFRASADMVLVPVTVTDRNGKTIEGLRANNFTIIDDQVPRQIVSFTTEDASCSVGVVLDVSGSMRNILGTAKEAAHAFVHNANPQDEFLLLTVSTQPEALSGFTTDIAALEKSLAVPPTQGVTALIDTVYLALSQMRHARWPQRALLILSDGMDNYSRYSKAELLRVAIEADVQIYSIIIDNPSGGGSSGGGIMRPAMVAKPWDHADQNQGRELLEGLSDKTGGLHFRVRNENEAKEAAIKTARALRNEYVIGYQVPDPGTGGKWHRVRVKSDVPKVSVYARNGYYSP
jgi:Ca-activated chloride channel family protein